MTLDDMLKAICISSANDAAVAVAEFVGGSEPAFVQQMNARAAELGLTAAPVAQGTHLGTVQLSSGGEVLASFPISAAQGVDALSFRYCFGRLVDSLLLYQGDFVQNK